jgi:hypothetical protein
VQKYPVRASARAGLSGENLAALCRKHFGAAEPDGAAVLSQFGALERLKVWAEGRELGIEVKMNPKVENATAHETIRRYNDFLREATGYSAKERASRLRKSASKGAA